MKRKINQKYARNNIKNSQRGITLVALVVTIIVLIILAAVSISLVLGENGIIKKAGDAKQNFQRAADEEGIGLNDLFAEMNEKISETSNPGGNNPQPGESGYAGGSYNDPYIPTGFNHVGSEDWNHGYTIQDDLENQFVWVPCSTAETLPDGVVRFQKTLPATNNSSDPNYKYNSNNYTLHPSGEPTETTTGVNAEDASVAAIRASVGNYGGFYIAKYEAGCPLDENENEIVPTSSTTITDFTNNKARSVKDANPWNYITRTNAITAASNMVTGSNVTSALISGECWDTALAWISKTDSSYATNSTGKGNYYEDANTNEWKGGKTTTGKLTAYGVNNIFDMAGNMYEYTTENCKHNSSQYVVYRGR